MIESLLVILSSPSLLGGLLLCALLGGVSFVAAIKLCSLKGIGVSTIKYALTLISIESLSNFFMIILSPSEFIGHYTAFHSVQIGLAILLAWIVFYEAKVLLKMPIFNRFKKI